MAEDRRISVADAARFLGTPDACRLIKWAWRRGAIRLFGIRPGENQPIVIPANEGRIDFATSRVVTGPFTWFQSVTMAWSDVKLLAQADVDRQARETRTVTKQTQVSMWAAELRRQFPEGPPAGWTRTKLEREVRKKSGGKLEMISLATLDRARKEAWPRAKSERASKASKPPR